MIREAYLSNCRRYRYWLTRVWDGSLPMYAVIGLNPSTADATVDDATIRKEIGFGQRLGFGGLLMLNVGAYRATDPREWHKAADPFGPENSLAHLQTYISRFKPDRVVAAWGKNVTKSRHATSRCTAITGAIPDLWCWGRNGDKTPRHPLMLSYSTVLEILGV